MRKYLAILLLVALPGEIYAGTIRSDVDSRAFLALGAQSTYASVGRLNTFQTGGSLISSGTLIAPDMVLTAAHSLDQANSLSFLLGGTTYEAQQWAAYPLWNGDLNSGYDLALIKLTTSVANVKPAVRYTGKSEVGKLATTVGYGMTGTGDSGATRYDGQKRAGTNTIDSLSAGKGDSARIMWEDFDRPGEKKESKGGATSLEYLIARGDSGGGVFIDTNSGTRLIGVSSFGYSTDGNVDASYGEKAGFTRVSAFNAWIDMMIARFTTKIDIAALLGRSGFRANDLFIPTPEPSTGLLLILGLAGLLRRRARQ